jgi:phage shock protein A
MTRTLLCIAALTVLVPAACSTSPSLRAPRASVKLVAPESMVATIRAAAGHDDSELAVQPLRDPRIEDLRQQAVHLEATHRYAEASAMLDKALAIVSTDIASTDPALLQERAEAAVLMQDYAGAEQFARRAYAIGAKVGPLCRRHWATVQQMRRVAGDIVGAASAQAQLEACKVAAPNRF